LKKNHGDCHLFSNCIDGTSYYWVVDLDEGYQLVAVSEPKREYLWVLSRTPKVDPNQCDALLKRLKAQEFDLSKLELTKQ
jgi:apolipoprotein D and lipocalin family protein